MSLAYRRGVPTVRLDLSRRAIRRLGLGIFACNLVFTAGTAVFIEEWSHRDWHGPAGRWLIDNVLVQFHLATENVVAAWYSSMLLLTVALASLLAFALDRRQFADRWLAPSVAGTDRGDRPLRQAVRRSLPIGWGIVAATFAGLSLDELGSLHERLGMLKHAGGSAHGWVYVLGVPILAGGAFMAAFAWIRLRRVPAALGLFAAGIALFLSDPVFELFEMSLLHAGRGDDLIVHNALLVIEEGLVELGGALCFLLGVLVYMRRTAGDGPHVIAITPRAIPWIAAAGLAMTAGVPAAHWLVEQLPSGDTGIPDNWFPAAALYVTAILGLATRGRRALPLATLALALSAAFGASLYGYFAWFARIGYPGVPLATATTAVASILALVLSGEH